MGVKVEGVREVGWEVTVVETVVETGIWAGMEVQAEALEIAGAWATECTFLYIGTFLGHTMTMTMIFFFVFFFLMWKSMEGKMKRFSRICWSPTGFSGALVKC